MTYSLLSPDPCFCPVSTMLPSPYVLLLILFLMIFSVLCFILYTPLLVGCLIIPIAFYSALPFISCPICYLPFIPSCFHSLWPSILCCLLSLLPYIPSTFHLLFFPLAFFYVPFTLAFISLWYRIIILRIFTGHERPGEARDEGALQGRSLAGPGQDQETRLARGLWCECRRWGLFAIEYSVSCLTSNRD